MDPVPVYIEDDIFVFTHPEGITVWLEAALFPPLSVSLARHAAFDDYLADRDRSPGPRDPPGGAVTLRP